VSKTSTRDPEAKERKELRSYFTLQGYFPNDIKTYLKRFYYPEKYHPERQAHGPLGDIWYSN
jgi:predicted metal-dependent hydrolase